MFLTVRQNEKGLWNRVLVHERVEEAPVPPWPDPLERAWVRLDLDDPRLWTDLLRWVDGDNPPIPVRAIPRKLAPRVKQELVRHGLLDNSR